MFKHASSRNISSKNNDNLQKQDLELDRKIDLVTEGLTTAKFCEVVLCLYPYKIRKEEKATGSLQSSVRERQDVLWMVCAYFHITMCESWHCSTEDKFNSNYAGKSKTYIPHNIARLY